MSQENKPPNNADDNAAIICVGMPGSASTWSFNAVRMLLSQAYGEDGFQSDYQNNLGRYVDLGQKPSMPLVLKTHHPDSLTQIRIAREEIPTIITLRDPRDCVTSLMQRFELPFNEAFAYVLRSVRRIQPCVNQGRRIVVFRYEDDYHNDIRSVEAIARLIGVTVPDAAVRAVHQSLSTRTVKKKLAAMAEEGRFTHNAGDGARPNMYDPVTHWHATHLGDGTIGKYKSLEDREVQVMDHAFWAFLRNHHYQLTDEHPSDDKPAAAS